MVASWIAVSSSEEIRLKNPVNRTGMSAGETERSYDLLNDPRFLDPDNAKNAIAIQDALQEDLTRRIRTRDLPADDPDRATDPARGERLFWEGNGANRELVSRSVIIESVVWDGTKYVITVRRAV